MKQNLKLYHTRQILEEIKIYACYVTLPPGDVFLAQLACPLNDIIFVYFLSDWSNWEH